MTHNLTERIKTWLAGGLLIYAILLLAIFMFIALLVKWHALANIARILPAEKTAGFIVLNREDFGNELAHFQLNELLGHPLSDLSFLGRDLAIAIIDGQTLTFYEIESKSDAEDFLNSIGEHEDGDQISCFSDLPTCFTFLGSYLVLSATEDSLLELYNPGVTLAETAEYQNVRGRLPSLQSGFIYIDLERARHELIRFASKRGISEPGFLESVFRIFPAFGAGLRRDSTGFYMESFTAVNKTVLGGEAYFHPTAKYEQKLLPFTQPFAMEWGTENGVAQIVRVRDILDSLNQTAGLIFESELEHYLTEFFGDAALTENNFLDMYAPLLNDEVYLGITPNEDFLFMTELSDENEIQLAGQLKDLFARAYKYKKTYETSEGEVKAELLPLDVSVKNEAGHDYYFFEADGKQIASIVLTESAFIVSGTEETLKTVLNRILSGQNRRPMSDFQVLLPGSDEIFVLNGAFFGEKSILDALLSTRKLFDDGVYTRSTLLLAP